MVVSKSSSVDEVDLKIAPPWCNKHAATPGWLLIEGIAIIGSPQETASRTVFIPQCEMTTDALHSSGSCVAYPTMMVPSRSTVEPSKDPPSLPNAMTSCTLIFQAQICLCYVFCRFVLSGWLVGWLYLFYIVPTL